MRRAIVLAGLFTAAIITSASADVVISSDATQNMSCSGGVCAPTATDAVLNVTDLETMLASGDLEITSIGGAHVHAKNIYLRAPVTSESAYTLTFLTNHLFVERRISVTGTGGLVVDAALALRSDVAIRFSNLSSAFSISGTAYKLVNSLGALVEAVAANPSGFFALASPYDASKDGTYSASPVTTNFLGDFEGLGNTISNISVDSTIGCCASGLFQSASQGEISHLHLRNISVRSAGGAAGLVYESFADIRQVSITGKIVSSSGDLGGLVGDNYGSIAASYSTANVSTGSTAAKDAIGGLVGLNIGSILDSFATGGVSAGDGPGEIGGLVGRVSQGGGVSNSYATGAVSGGADATVGGLIGHNDYDTASSSGVDSSYSTGAVSAGSGSVVGGFIGENDNKYDAYDYWDTDTSGTDIGVGLGDASNVAGLTTSQLQSGLPTGFSPRIWTEKTGINNGMPYLRRIPPSK